MFQTLPESRPARRRSSGGAALSFVLHYAGVLLLVLTSAEAAQVHSTPRQETVVFQQPVDEPPPPTSPIEQVAPLPPRDVRVLVAPIGIPDVIPEINLRLAITNPEEVLAWRPGSERILGGDGPGSEVTSPSPNGVYRDFEVEEPVRLAPGVAAPEYPDLLRRAGVEGSVLVSFVVDTLGRVDMGTFTVIHTTHGRFADAVRTAVARQRFVAARIGMQRVRQLVQQPFAFTIVR